jgi:hypothetical protein
MITKLSTIIISTFLFGCGQTKQSDNSIVDNGTNELSFSNYSSKINQIDLPLQTICDNNLSGYLLEFTDSTIAKFGPEYSRIHGKLADKEKFTAIIYLYPADIILPIIQTTDKKGKKISDLQLFEKYCGSDEFSWSTSWAQINKDLTIQLSDSTITYDRNEEGEIIDSTRKTEVRHRHFYISDKGKILERK